MATTMTDLHLTAFEKFLRPTRRRSRLRWLYIVDLPTEGTNNSACRRLKGPGLSTFNFQSALAELSVPTSGPTKRVLPVNCFF